MYYMNCVYIWSCFWKDDNSIKCSNWVDQCCGSILLIIMYTHQLKLIAWLISTSLYFLNNFNHYMRLPIWQFTKPCYVRSYSCGIVACSYNMYCWNNKQLNIIMGMNIILWVVGLRKTLLKYPIDFAIAFIHLYPALMVTIRVMFMYIDHYSFPYSSINS